MQNLMSKFNRNTAFKAFVNSSSKRKFGEFIEKAGVELICQYIESGRMITDAIPVKDKATWKQSLLTYKSLFHLFSENDIYYWVPDQYRVYFEEKYGDQYRSYMRKQASVIKDFLLN